MAGTQVPGSFLASGLKLQLPAVVWLFQWLLLLLLFSNLSCWQAVLQHNLLAIQPCMHLTIRLLAGLLLITHFTLLLGMAAPIWLSNALDSAPEAAAGSSSPHAVWPAAYAGIFVIGGWTDCCGIVPLVVLYRLCCCTPPQQVQ
jgi:hypothetical protein